MLVFRQLSWILLLLVALLLPACASAPPTTPAASLPTAPADVAQPPTVISSPAVPTPQQPTPNPDSLPVNAAGVQLVAKVNQAEITLPEFQRALARRQQGINAADPAALEASVLDQLVEQALISQGAAAQQIQVTDQEVDAELQTNREQAGGDGSWQQWLADNLYTEEEYRETIRLALITLRVRDSLTADLSGNVPQVHARHILVKNEGEAKTLLDRLRAGEDFAVLASQFSVDDTTRELGGDLGWFTREELFVPELAQVAFSLQPGQIGGPVATTLGYHLVQTLETGERAVEPERQFSIAQTRFENWLQPLLMNAIIERYW